ncbi:P-loop containing nucleoside triphosphate hydrolase protein [Rhizophagus irregularis DAOM 181602=DAOM 197198]|nr:P-loop containing nucleoside triphosphate hydrolase protein [Rhizophagus irregularis DAOM 181602=DAOM 197198]
MYSESSSISLTIEYNAKNIYLYLSLVYFRSHCGTVEKGTRPIIDISDDELVPRPLVVERLKKIFQPNRNQSFYHVGGMGVIYVEIPSDTEDKDVEHFGKAFRKSLNFRFEEHISFTAQLMKKILGDNGEADRRPKWRRALEAFKNSGTVSEGSVSGRMESRSAGYINEVEAKKLYELVCGRIVELKTVADDFLNGQSFEVNTAQLLRKQLHHEVGKKAIKALLDSKELGFTTFIEFFDNYEEVDKSNNIREASEIYDAIKEGRSIQ